MQRQPVCVYMAWPLFVVLHYPRPAHTRHSCHACPYKSDKGENRPTLPSLEPFFLPSLCVWSDEHFDYIARGQRHVDCIALCKLQLVHVGQHAGCLEICIVGVCAGREVAKSWHATAWHSTARACPPLWLIQGADAATLSGRSAACCWLAACNGLASIHFMWKSRTG